MSIIFCYRRQINNFFLILSCISGKTLMQELQISLHNNILLRSTIRYGTQSKKIQNVLSFLNVNLTLSFHKLIGHLNAQQALLLKYFGLHEHRRKQGGSRPKSKKLKIIFFLFPLSYGDGEKFRKLSFASFLSTYIQTFQHAAYYLV